MIINKNNWFQQEATLRRTNDNHETNHWFRHEGGLRKIKENQTNVLISARVYPYANKRKSTKTIDFSKRVNKWKSTKNHWFRQEGGLRKIKENQTIILISARGYPYANKRKSTKTIDFSKGVPLGKPMETTKSHRFRQGGVLRNINETQQKQLISTRE